MSKQKKKKSKKACISACKAHPNELLFLRTINTIGNISQIVQLKNRSILAHMELMDFVRWWLVATRQERFDDKHKHLLDQAKLDAQGLVDLRKKYNKETKYGSIH